MFRRFTVRIGGEIKDITFEHYSNLTSLDRDLKKFLTLQINSILRDCWGIFNEEFIDGHIMASNKMVFAKSDQEYIGFGVLSLKKIKDKDIHYVEFIAIKKEFQRAKLSQKIFYLIIRDYIISNFFSLFFRPMEIMFITPNIRVLAGVSKLTSFSYPNPNLINHEGKIDPADDTTWEMAQELIRNTDKPNRKLHREGLVLHDSYEETPWLVYGPQNAPWVDDPKLLKFVERYMGYHKGEDKELVVRAHISLSSLIKYIYRIASK